MLLRLKYLADVLFVDSRAMPPPYGPVLRLLRFPTALLRDWFAGELAVRAMSLAYTTLLSIVPLIAFSFAILKGLGARADIAGIVYEFFRPVGSAAAELTARVMQFVQNMRGDVLGSIGLAFLIYTVVTTIQKVEASFNFVWRVERPRSLARVFSEYLGAMIVGPLLLAAALALAASARNSPVALWIGAIVPLDWTVSFLGKLVPYAIVAGVFTAMYALVPNTRVKISAALVGGLSAGALWALVGKLFTAFIAYSSRMLAIYTGFAVVLTTLIWIYLSWLILLIGAQLAFYVQHPQYLRRGLQPVDLTGSAREQAGLSVMYLIGRDFALGRCRWTGSLLAEELEIPSAALSPVLRCLEHGGLLVATEKERFVPGRAIQAISLADVVDAVRNLAPGRWTVAPRALAPALTTMHEVESAMRGRLADRTLKDLIDGA